MYEIKLEFGSVGLCGGSRFVSLFVPFFTSLPTYFFIYLFLPFFIFDFLVISFCLSFYFFSTWSVMGKQNNIVKFGFSAVPVFRSVPERFGVPGFITCHSFNAPINVKPQGEGGGSGYPREFWFREPSPEWGFWHLVAATGSGIWHVRHLGRPREPGNKSSTIIPTYLTINLVLKLFVFHLSRFFYIFPFNTLIVNHSCTYLISTIYHLLYVICIYLWVFNFSFSKTVKSMFAWVYIKIKLNWNWTQKSPGAIDFSAFLLASFDNDRKKGKRICSILL